MQRRGLVVQRGPWTETPRDAMRKGIPLAQIDRQYQYKQQYGVMDNPLASQALASGNPETTPAEQPQQVINNYQSAPEEYAAPIAPETCLPGYTYSQSLGYCVRNINYYGCIPGVEFWDPVSQTCSRNWPVCGEGGVNDLNTGVCIYPAKPTLPAADYNTFKAITGTTLTEQQYNEQVAAGNTPTASNENDPIGKAIAQAGAAIDQYSSTTNTVQAPAKLTYAQYLTLARGPTLSEEQFNFLVTEYEKQQATPADTTVNLTPQDAGFFSKDILNQGTEPVGKVALPSVSGVTEQSVSDVISMINQYATLTQDEKNAVEKNTVEQNRHQRR
jgi:hypothetical protein